MVRVTPFHSMKNIHTCLIVCIYVTTLGRVFSCVECRRADFCKTFGHGAPVTLFIYVISLVNFYVLMIDNSRACCCGISLQAYFTRLLGRRVCIQVET